MDALPTGTVTFLYTDIEGSTTLWEQQPEPMRAAIAWHDGLLRQAITGAGGHVFRGTGDGLCAAFSTAPAAVVAALAAQRALVAATWDLPRPLRVRMALHTGAVEARAGDYVGACLNRLARLLAAGHGGQALLSGVVQELVRDALPAGAGLRDLGQHRLRDLVQPEQVYQLLHPELPANFPPLRSLDAYQHNLPLQLTSFVGREAEMAEVTRLLSTTRLLTLTGTGGCGKTRLALQVAADLVDAYPNGVWLVELAPLTDPELVGQTVAFAIGIAEQPGQPMIMTLVGSLRRRKLLLVLDNCEHLLDASAQLVEALLRACPDLRILATSRELLGVAGEVAWRVLSLETPDPAHLPALDQVVALEAVRLFTDRARLVQPAFLVTSQNAAAVAQVCRRLDGIPLALELAAARATALSVEQLAVRLDDRFRLLTGGRRTALRRQQTLQATVDWSHDLLTEPERVLFRRLAVFVGGWTLEAAEAVAAGDGVEAWEVIDLLTRLVEKSLVVVEALHEATRYRLLETVRQYAGEKLLASGEAAAARNRHRDWCLALVEHAEPLLATQAQDAWLTRLDSEVDNLRAALAWCQSGTADLGLRLATSLYRYWFYGARPAEGAEWLTRLLAVAGDPTPDRARALGCLGNLVYLTSDDLARAEAMLHESIALSRELKLSEPLYFALRQLRHVLFHRHGPVARVAVLAEALAMSRDRGDRHGEGMLLQTMGVDAGLGGNLPRAGALLDEGLALLRAVGDAAQIGRALGERSTVAQWAGDYAQALHLVDEVEHLGDSEQAIDRGEIWFQRSTVAWARGDVALALSEGERVLAWADREQPHVMVWFPYSRLVLARAVLAAGDLLRARALLTEALPRARDLVGAAHYWLGRVEWAAGDHPAARQQLRGALRFHHTRGEWAYMPDTLEAIAGVLLADGASASAVRWLAAMATRRTAWGLPRPPIEQASMEATLATARTALGEDAFAVSWAEGQALTLEEAVAEALAEDATTPT